MKFSAAIGLMAMASFSAGCATTHSNAPTTTTPDSVVFETLEPGRTSTSLAAAELCSLTAGSEVFLLVDDDGREAGRLTITREATTAHGATVACREDTGRTQYLRTDDDGNIIMTAVLEPDDHAISLFDPPLVIAPVLLNSEEPQTFKAAMRVVDSRDPGNERERGTATRTIRLSGEQRIRTSRGLQTALTIEIEFTADLKLANATDRSTTYVVPGQGVIAEVSEEKVKILGAFGKTKRRTVVRQD